MKTSGNLDTETLTEAWRREDPASRPGDHTFLVWKPQSWVFVTAAELLLIREGCNVVGGQQLVERGNREEEQVLGDTELHLGQLSLEGTKQ